MGERPSPPGPREMVQEWKTINTYSLPGFEEEVAPQPTDEDADTPETMDE